MKSSIRVLVTGVSGGSIGEQVCKALRFGKYNYELTITNVSISLLSVMKADNYAVLPYASSENYFESLLSTVKKYNTQFIIPGSEPELMVIAKNREQLVDVGVIPLINSQEVISTCVNKLKTYEKLEENHLKVPESIVLVHIEELSDWTGNPPWVVKPVSGTGGSTFVFIAQDIDELQFFSNYLIKNEHIPLIQNYVGHADQEYTIGVLNSPDGELLGSIVFHRQIISGLSNRFRVVNRTGRPELGEMLVISSGISQGSVVEFPQIRKSAEDISKALGSSGPMNIQGRWVDDAFIMFEINPRFSGTSPMRAMVGFNEPELLIKWHQGYTVDKSISIRYGEFTRGIVEYFKEKEFPQ